MYKKILVPIDFSRESASAVDSAVMLAKKEDSDVFLLNVIEDSYREAFESVGIDRDNEDKDVVNQLKKAIEKKMEDIVGKINEKGTRTQFEVRVGNVFKTIAEYVNTIDADVIVMGSKGKSDVKEVLVGSITEKVVRYVSCPVITVKEKCDLGNIKSIVYSSDLKPEQETVVKDLKKFQQFTGANLHLVKVFDSEFLNKKHVEERMRKFASYFGLDNYSITAIEHADESDAILQFAQSVDAGMIAIATHYKRGLELFFDAKISKNIVENAKRPIWSKRVN